VVVLVREKWRLGPREECVFVLGAGLRLLPVSYATQCDRQGTARLLWEASSHVDNLQGQQAYSYRRLKRDRDATGECKFPKG
jgi:hypothetical protein